MGYYRAGFDVVGVDIKPMPRYPFEFHQADALEYCAAHGEEFDAIHASPPCQHYSEANPIEKRILSPDLIGAVREVLIATGKPYVIENVENARKHLVNPFMLCGSMFGMKIWRHRYFESVMFLMSPASCQHRDRPITLYPGSNARANRNHPIPSIIESRYAMGIDWMIGEEIREAIPPAYTEFIGRHMLETMQKI